MDQDVTHPAGSKCHPSIRLHSGNAALQRYLPLLGCPPYRPGGNGRAISNYGKACHPTGGVGCAAKPVEHIADRDRAEKAGREPRERI